jgi:hypothetical protein
MATEVFIGSEVDVSRFLAYEEKGIVSPESYYRPSVSVDQKFSPLISEWVGNFEDTREIRIFGRASTGFVRLVKDTDTHQLIARKTYSSDQKATEMFFHDIEMLACLRHPCVISLVGYSLPTGIEAAQVGTEFAAKGPLQTALGRRSSSLDDTSKAIVIVGLVLGMQFAHLIGVVHRDLDPKNILFDEKSYVEIDGFGRSRFIEPNLMLTTAVGAGVYMAPEMYETDDYTQAVDIFSFAVIFNELLFGEPAFLTRTKQSAAKKEVMRGVSGEVPASTDPTVRDIITRGWSPDPGERPSFDDILSALEGIEFRVTPSVDSVKVAAYVEMVRGPSFSSPRPLHAISELYRGLSEIDWEGHGLIGQGAFGVVYAGVVGSSSYPLTTGFSTYWYGDYWLASSNRWTQLTSSSTDYIFAMWWHNISVPGSGLNNISFLFRSGLHYREQPTVSVTAHASTVPASGTFLIELLLSDRIPTQMLYVFMVIDSDLYSISGVGSGLSAGTIEVGVDLVSQSVSLDTDNSTFYSVNDIGFISDGYSISVTVFTVATPAPSESTRSTASPLA